MFSGRISQLLTGCSDSQTNGFDKWLPLNDRKMTFCNRLEAYNSTCESKIQTIRFIQLDMYV